MSHVRKQIRDYFAVSLNGLTTTGSKVYASRVYPLQSENLPAVLVYTTSEDSDEAAFSKQRVQNRVVDVMVEGYVKAVTGFDDTLDQIAREVEEALLDDPTCGGLSQNMVLTSTETEYSGEGETPVGTIRMTFQVNYRTVTGSPDSAI